MVCWHLHFHWCIGNGVRFKLIHSKCIYHGIYFSYKYLFHSNPEVLVLNGIILTPYPSGINGTLHKYKACGELWRAAGMVMPQYVFGATSSLFVALIVLLRLIMIKRPMSYQNVHKSVSRIGCIVIWVVSLLVSSVYFIVHLPPLYAANVVRIVTAIATFGLLTAPILLTILLYVMLLCSLKTPTAARSTANEATITQMKALAKMTHGVVAGLIICNLPGLMYIAYTNAMIGRGRGGDIFTSNISV